MCRRAGEKVGEKNTADSSPKKTKYAETAREWSCHSQRPAGAALWFPAIVASATMTGRLFCFQFPRAAAKWAIKGAVEVARRFLPRILMRHTHILSATPAPLLFHPLSRRQRKQSRGSFSLSWRRRIHHFSRTYIPDASIPDEFIDYSFASERACLLCARV